MPPRKPPRRCRAAQGGGKLENVAVGQRKKTQTFQASFLHRGKWWIAWTDDVPGALTQGRTLEEARENLKDAVRLMLEPVEMPARRAQPQEIIHETLQF